MDLSDLLGFHQDTETIREQAKEEAKRYWMFVPFYQYKAGVPVVNRYPRTYSCWLWIQEGIKLIIVLSNGYKESVSEETFAEAVRRTISGTEGSHS